MTAQWTVHIKQFSETEVIEFEDYREACTHADERSKQAGYTTEVYDWEGKAVRSTSCFEIDNFEALTPNQAGRYVWDSEIEDMRKVES